MAVAFKHVYVVVGDEEYDVQPVIRDRSDVRLPVEVIGSEAEVRREEVVLDDVRVLPGHHLEDLFDRVEVLAAMDPRSAPPLRACW